MNRTRLLAACAAVAVALAGCDDGGGGATDGGAGDGAVPQCVVLEDDFVVDTLLSAPCYLVTRLLLVSDGATLTIDPGVKLSFQADAGLEITESGALVAVGTDAAPVLFTGEQAVPGHWRGLVFTNSDHDNVVDFAVVEHGGGDAAAPVERQANVVVQSSGFPVRLSLSNTTLRQSAGYGLSLAKQAAAPAFELNTLTDNALGAAIVASEVAGLLDVSTAYAGNAVDVVHVISDTVPADQTWQALDVPYLLAGRLFVSAALTIAAGATLAFDEDANLQVESTGTLIAVGDAAAPIIFTGAQKTRGWWRGIFVVNSDNDNVIDNAIVEYGGGDAAGPVESQANVVLQSTGFPVRLAITNTTLRQSAGYGLRVPVDATLPSCYQNTITGNALGPALLDSEVAGQLDDSNTYVGNDVDVMAVNADTIPGDQTWFALGVPYQVDGILFVDAQLTLAPGVELRFTLDSRLMVTDTGTLTAIGTPQAPILLTGTVKTPGHWGGVYLDNSNHDNTLEQVVVEYGGGNGPGAGGPANLAAVSSGFPVNFNAVDCIFRSSAAWGVWISKYATHNDVAADNTFSGNSSGDVHEEL